MLRPWGVRYQGADGHSRLAEGCKGIVVEGRGGCEALSTNMVLTPLPVVCSPLGALGHSCIFTLHQAGMRPL